MTDTNTPPTPAVAGPDAKRLDEIRLMSQDFTLGESFHRMAIRDLIAALAQRDEEVARLKMELAGITDRIMERITNAHDQGYREATSAAEARLEEMRGALEKIVNQEPERNAWSIGVARAALAAIRAGRGAT